MDTTKKEYGNKLKGTMIEDNTQSLTTCPKCDDLIIQEFPNIVNTKFKGSERKNFYTWSCYCCRTEIMSYQTN